MRKPLTPLGKFVKRITRYPNPPQVPIPISQFVPIPELAG